MTDADLGDPADPTDVAALPQGSPELLDTPLARRLLASAIPARVAYMAKDATPRITATWFQWTDGELVMPTFIRAPHVPAPARRLSALRAPTSLSRSTPRAHRHKCSSSGARLE